MYVFVYGSLKKNFHNNDLLSNAEFIGNGVTDSKYFMINLGNFPGVISGFSKISGEVYKINFEILQDLDILEGNGEFYQRHEIPIHGNFGIINAFMYMLINYDEKDKINFKGKTLEWDQSLLVQML